MLPFTLPLSFLQSRFMFALVRHSFASLIDKQLSRKATLLEHVSLFERFQRTLPLILFYFHLNQFINVIMCYSFACRLGKTFFLSDGCRFKITLHGATR